MALSPKKKTAYPHPPNPPARSCSAMPKAAKTQLHQMTAKATLQMVAQGLSLGTSGSTETLLKRIVVGSNKAAQAAPKTSKKANVKVAAQAKTKSTAAGGITLKQAIQRYVVTGMCDGDMQSIKVNGYCGPPIKDAKVVQGNYVKTDSKVFKTAVVQKKAIAKAAPPKKKVHMYKPASNGVRLSAAGYFYNTCGGKISKCEPQLILQPDGQSYVVKVIKLDCNGAPKWQKWSP